LKKFSQKTTDFDSKENACNSTIFGGKLFGARTSEEKWISENGN
jgi:hypothetical protein